jgi:hypothetical protein
MVDSNQSSDEEQETWEEWRKRRSNTHSVLFSDANRNGQKHCEQGEVQTDVYKNDEIVRRRAMRAGSMA